jgi:hypothetical protein
MVSWRFLTNAVLAIGTVVMCMYVVKQVAALGITVAVIAAVDFIGRRYVEAITVQ